MSLADVATVAHSHMTDPAPATEHGYDPTVMMPPTTRVLRLRGIMVRWAHAPALAIRLLAMALVILLAVFAVYCAFLTIDLRLLLEEVQEWNRRIHAPPAVPSLSFDALLDLNRFRNAIAAHPRFSREILVMRANALARVQRWAEAAATWEEAARFGHLSDDERLSRAQVLVRVGEEAMARDLIESIDQRRLERARHAALVDLLADLTWRRGLTTTVAEEP